MRVCGVRYTCVLTSSEWCGVIIVWSWALQSRPRPSRLRKTLVLMMPSLWMMMSLLTMMVRISAGLCSV